ncbi:MAG: DUF3883 domain-containing protein [Methylorubrum extorquens]|jgi:hypothetical protein|uniref:DUF3883 domain-containing protein n=1 Tax=Methylorubrum extorquens TaxID=408 RepID=UPI002FEE17CA
MVSGPVVFINIGWMNKYAGQTPDDPTLGGHGFLKGNNGGHEAWNFAPYRGKLYGYVPRSARINLKNLGGKSTDVSLDGITVIWIAKNPRDKKTYIVGWYDNATVLSHGGETGIEHVKGIPVGYHAVAKKGTLLPLNQRLFHIPTAKVTGNLGQSPVWYGGTDQFRARALAYVESGGLIAPNKTKKTGTPKQPDPEARKSIELAAVKHATDFYQSVEGGSRSVHSVEKDGAGWDLTVTAPTGAVLKVEVKGLTGRDIIVELTPNEYKKMCSLEHRAEYVVYIVTEAGTAKARSHVFLHNQETSKGGKLVWATADGRKLKIAPMTAAKLSAEYGPTA